MSQRKAIRTNVTNATLVVVYDEQVAVPWLDHYRIRYS